jgi:AraC-like DNA-binding protein
MNHDPQHVELKGNADAMAETLSALFVELAVQESEACQDAILCDIDTQRFGDFEFLRTNVSRGGFIVARTSELVARSTFNNFFIGCLIDGYAKLSQMGHHTELSASDIAVLDSSSEYTIEVPDILDCIWVRVPRHRLEGRLATPRDVMAQRIDGCIGTGKLTSQLLRESYAQAGDIPITEALRVSNAILDLLSLSLSIPTDTHARFSDPLLRRIQNYIELNLDDPELSLSEVAKAHGISVRYVNKLFEREGISTAKWIRLRRLERCRGDIESLSTRSQSISQIAYAHGFGDISTFNRAFKKQYGVAPKALRH